MTLRCVCCCDAIVIYLRSLSETNILLDYICSFMTLMSFKVQKKLEKRSFQPRFDGFVVNIKRSPVDKTVSKTTCAD
ncbi:MAG: hypothetical protein RLZZ04_2546 [Cyanobacteriota bacterium]